MKSQPLHSWNLSPKEAVEIQKHLSARVSQTNHLKTVRFVAGADIAISKNPPLAFAGVVVLSFPDLKIVEECGVVSELTFPYIPGLLAFREAPALLKVFDRIRHEPDLLMIDGQGIAHPRGCGIACHIGLWLDKPTIGCAKSHLFGKYRQPPLNGGSWTPLTGHHDQRIGAVVRTKDKTNPIFVSVGHQVDLPSAIRYVLACSQGFRIPEPTRQADHFVARLKREKIIGTASSLIA